MDHSVYYVCVCVWNLDFNFYNIYYYNINPGKCSVVSDQLSCTDREWCSVKGKHVCRSAFIRAAGIGRQQTMYVYGHRETSIIYIL